MNNGWWTYKVCHKVNVTQYHASGKDGEESDMTLLGLFDKEYDWKNKKMKDRTTEIFYHNVSYVNGSTCDLTGNLRKTTVRYDCAKGSVVFDSIIRVEEPATCEYVITVHSSKLCEHPVFYTKEKTKKVNLICRPALTGKGYSKYLQKQKKEADEREEKEKRRKEELENVRKEELERKVLQNEGENERQDELGKQNMQQKSKDGLVGLFDEIFSNILDIKGDASKKNVRKDALKLDFGFNKDKKKEEVDLKNGDSEIGKLEKNDLKEETEGEAAKSANEMLADGFKKLDSRTSTLMSDQKKRLVKEFEKTREETLKEIKRSEELLSTMKKLRSLDGANQNEFDKTVGLLEESIKSNKRLIDDLDKRMERVQNLEKNVERNLKHIDDLVGKEKKVQNAAKKKKKMGVPGKLLEITKLMSKHMDNKKKGGSRFKRFQEIISSVVEDDGDNEEYEALSFWEGFNKKLDSQIVKFKEMASSLSEDSESSSSKYDGESKEVRDTENEEKEEETGKSKGKHNEKGDFQVSVNALDNEKLASALLDEELEEGEVNDETKIKVKEMEEKVKQQLKEAGLNFQNNIKVKIIRKSSSEDFKKFDDKNLLSAEQAKEIKDMFVDILEGGHEKKTEEKRQKTLENNYNIKIEDEEDDAPRHNEL